MKVLNLIGRTVSIDTDKLSKGLCDLHNEDEEMKAALAFGMLDAKLCDIFETNLTESIKKQFSSVTNQLFKDEIKTFTNECIREIEKGVYSYAKMIV